MQWSMTCPNDEVVVGFYGRSGLILDQLGLVCGALSIEGTSVIVEETVSIGPFGGNGGSPFGEGCPAGQIARGNDLMVTDGAWVNAFALVCGEPSLAY
jgi:hypothetical protein